MSAEKSLAHDPLPNIDSLAFQACFKSLYLFYHVGMTLGFSLRMQGRENMPKSGPVLVVANHQSFLDPVAIALTLGRPLVYLARKTLFRNRFFGALIRGLNAVPIDQEGLGKEGLRTVIHQLQLGKGVVIFPEGARTPDGNLQEFRAGIHVIIKRTNVPILPLGIAGAYDAWPIWRPYPIPAPLFLPVHDQAGTISVALGKPVDRSFYDGMRREDVTRDLFERVAVEQQRAEKLRRRGEK